MKVYLILEGCINYDEYEGGVDECPIAVVDTEENAQKSLENWLDWRRKNSYHPETSLVKIVKPEEDDPIQDKYEIWFDDYCIRYEPYEVQDKPLNYIM